MWNIDGTLGYTMAPATVHIIADIRTVQVAMLLHNFCVDCSGFSTDGLLSDAELLEIRDYTHAITSQENSRPGRSSGMPGRRVTNNESKRRNNLLEKVQDLGLTRPQ